jgi:hypothetical protein
MTGMAWGQLYQQAETIRGRKTMPSVSKAQRRYFGMLDHDPAKRKAAGVSKQTAHDFAASKEKGLPERVPKKRKYYGRD